MQLPRVRVTVEGYTDRRFAVNAPVSIATLALNELPTHVYPRSYMQEFIVTSVETVPAPLKVGDQIHAGDGLVVPVGTVLRATGGLVMELGRYGWYAVGHADNKGTTLTGHAEMYPMTVLYVPEETQ